MMRTSLYACLAGLGLLAAAGQARADETPLSVYLDALNNNPGYQAVQAGRDAQHEDVAIARAGLLPSVSAGLERGRNRVDHSIGSIYSERLSYKNYSYGVNVRQPILRPYEIARYQQANRQSDVADSQLAGSRVDLAIKTLTSYFDAAYAQDLVNLLDARQASLEAQTRGAEKAYVAGIGSKVEISDARAKRDIVLAQKLDAQNQQDHSMRQLQAYAGRPLDNITLLSPAKFSTAMPRPLDLAGWIAAADTGNPELAAARSQVAVAEKEVSKATAGHLPTVDLVAGRTLTGNNTLDQLSPYGEVKYQQNMIGVQVNIPIFSGGGVSATVRQADKRLLQAQLQAADAKENLEVQVRQEYGNLTQGAVKIRAYEQAEASAAENLLATRKGVQAGERSNLDVLQAEEQLYTTRRDLSLARYQLLLSRLRLLSYAGQLADDDVSEISTWFEPRQAQAAASIGAYNAGHRAAGDRP
jgi:TolC family type I secretion outer membrane protein